MIDRGNNERGRELYKLAVQEVRRTSRGLPAQDFDDAVQAALVHMLEREHLIDTTRSDSDVRGYRRRVFRSGAISFLMWRAKRLAEWPAGDLNDPASPGALNDDPCDRDDPNARPTVPGRLTTPTSPAPDHDFEHEAMRREMAAVLVEAERRLSPRELELLRHRLGIEQMSESLASAHYGTRGALAYRGRNKMLQIADDLGVQWLATETLFGLFAA